MPRTLILNGPDILELSRVFKTGGNRPCYRGNMIGSSMWPILRSGDGIVVEQKPEDAIRPGDILVFCGQTEKLVAHRLRRIRTDGQTRRYIPRGDFLLHDDPAIPYDALVGVVVEIERRGRSIRPSDPAQRLKTATWLLFRPVLVPCARLLGKIKQALNSKEPETKRG